jgi:hypothetical protein
MTDWKTVAETRGLQLSEAELTRLAGAMDALEAAYRALVANLTYDIEPATTLAEEAMEA